MLTSPDLNTRHGRLKNKKTPENERMMWIWVNSIVTSSKGLHSRWWLKNIVVCCTQTTGFRHLIVFFQEDGEQEERSSSNLTWAAQKPYALVSELLVRRVDMPINRKFTIWDHYGQLPVFWRIVCCSFPWFHLWFLPHANPIANHGRNCRIFFIKGWLPTGWSLKKALLSFYCCLFGAMFSYAVFQTSHQKRTQDRLYMLMDKILHLLIRRLSTCTQLFSMFDDFSISFWFW